MAVLQRILNAVLNDPNLDRLIELTNRELSRETESARAIAMATRERLTDMRRRLGRLDEAIETGQVDLSDLGPRIRELRAQEQEFAAALENSEKERDEARGAALNRGQLLGYLQDLKALLSAGMTA